MLVRHLQGPDDERAVQAAAGHVQGVGGPGHTVHLGRVEAPLRLEGLLVVTASQNCHLNKQKLMKYRDKFVRSTLTEYLPIYLPI